MSRDELIKKFLCSGKAVIGGYGLVPQAYNESAIECANIAQEYANQRVVEELGKLRGIGITYTDDAIDKRIKELKK